jgi:hypothetical protein
MDLWAMTVCCLWSCCWSRSGLIRFFSFLGRVGSRLLQALGIRLQARCLRSALGCDGRFFIGTRTARDGKDAQGENQKQKGFHNVEVVWNERMTIPPRLLLPRAGPSNL